MDHGLLHSAERKAFEKAVSKAIKKVDEEGATGYQDLISEIEKVMGNAWSKEAYRQLREAFTEDGKWTAYFDHLLATADRDYLKGILMAFGFEGGFTGYRRTQKMAERYGISIPWIILFDPTSACNLHCAGCWAAEYNKNLNLSNEDMESIVAQGKELGIRTYLMTGGEPLVRRRDIVSLARRHPECGFMIFTNGTLINQEFCNAMKECRNILLCISIEGKEETTDARRGAGTFWNVTEAMDLLRINRLPFGTSICYTRYNCEEVTSDEFLDFLIDKGAAFSWYFHYMPIGMHAQLDLLPTVEQREYMYHRIREIRGVSGGKPIFCMDFQNDGEFVDGCIAGGKYYCHINPNGDVEPCVFVHYSGANIHDRSLLDCLRQPLFREYQKRQPFNQNMLQPCPMLENPAYLWIMVKETGAKSTDMAEPESCDHLCEKCMEYADRWKVVADKLWESNLQE